MRGGDSKFAGVRYRCRARARSRNGLPTNREMGTRDAREHIQLSARLVSVRVECRRHPTPSGNTTGASAVSLFLPRLPGSTTDRFTSRERRPVRRDSADRRASPPSRRSFLFRSDVLSPGGPSVRRAAKRTRPLRCSLKGIPHPVPSRQPAPPPRAERALPLSRKKERN